MAISVNKIAFGPGRLYVGATLPAANSAPVFTAGVPAGGIDLGATKSASVVTLKPGTYEVMVEQAHTPIEAFSSKFEASIEAELLEIDIDRFVQYLASVTKNIAPPIVQGGTLVPIVKFSVVLVQRRVDDPTRLMFAMLYRAYCPDGIQLPFSREKESSFKVKFAGLADLTRAEGDQTAQIGFDEAWN